LLLLDIVSPPPPAAAAGAPEGFVLAWWAARMSGMKLCELVRAQAEQRSVGDVDRKEVKKYGGWGLRGAGSSAEWSWIA
jgi:hypothetical protein